MNIIEGFCMHYHLYLRDRAVELLEVNLDPLGKTKMSSAFEYRKNSTSTGHLGHVHIRTNIFES